MDSLNLTKPKYQWPQSYNQWEIVQVIRLARPLGHKPVS